MPGWIGLLRWLQAAEDWFTTLNPAGMDIENYHALHFREYINQRRVLDA